MRIGDWSSDVCSSDLTILYAACFDANGGLFEPLLGENDAIVSDALNHASIIDGVRLCKARRYRYANCDMADLEEQLQQARTDGAGTIMITTDGVFSMDGFIAPLDEITRSEEHTSELQSLMRISYAVFCLQKKTKTKTKRSK